MPCRFPSLLQEASARSLTSSRACARATPQRCWPLRSSTTASIRSARPSASWPLRAWRYALISSLVCLAGISGPSLFPLCSRQCMSQIMSNDVLTRLAATIKARRNARPEDSHTRRLLDGAPVKPAKKLGEEAVEVAIAALAQDKEALTGEAADLLYHLLVVLESRHIALDDVLGELERRMIATDLEQKG